MSKLVQIPTKIVHNIKMSKHEKRRPSFKFHTSRGDLRDCPGHWCWLEVAITSSHLLYFISFSISLYLNIYSHINIVNLKYSENKVCVKEKKHCVINRILCGKGGFLGLGPGLRSCSQVLLTADTRVWYSDVLSELRGAAVALLIRRS